MLLCHTLGIGGSERQLTETAKALDRERFEVHVGAFHAEGLRAGDLQAAGIPVIELPVRSFGNATLIRGAIALRRYVKQHGIRLLHSFDVPLNIFLAFAYPLQPRPVVLTSQRGHRSLSPALHRNLVRVSDRLTDGIVVNCEFMKRHLVDEERVRPDVIDICYNGIDTERFSPGSPRGASVLIGAVCALRAEKDVPTLLRAFATLLGQRSDAKLLIVGSGPELDKLVSLADELGISGSTVFQPATPDVVPWLRMMDIFVLPSVSEALSNALIEAMACGVCAVASRVGGNPELLGNNDERGFLFTAGNAEGLAGVLARLASDERERVKKAAIAREWIVANMSIAAAAERMSAIYQRHLARRGVSS